MYKKYLISALLCFSSIGVAHAYQQTGQLINYHLNSDASYVNRDVGYGDRAVCVQMKPAVPTSGWACLYTGNRLYTEINALLREGYMNKKKCDIYGSTTDSDGYLMISMATCTN